MVVGSPRPVGERSTPYALAALALSVLVPHPRRGADGVDRDTIMTNPYSPMYDPPDGTDPSRACVIAALREEIATLEKAEAEVQACLQELRAVLAELENHSPPN